MGYVTFKDQAEAEKLCKALVEQKLIACANLHPAHLAIYQWNSALARESEVSATLKTTKDRIPAIKKYIAENHSYSVPGLVFWPIEEGTDNFLKWIYKQTHD